MLSKKLLIIFILFVSHIVVAGKMSDADFDKITAQLRAVSLSQDQRQVLASFKESSITEEISESEELIEVANTPKKQRSTLGFADKEKRSIDIADGLTTPPPKSRARITFSGSKKNNNRSFYASPGFVEGDKEAPRARDNFVVYAHMLTKGKEPLIDRNDRIKFPEILSGREVTASNLDEALLAIENKVREWIHQNKNIYYSTTYIGLAENLVHRAHGHVGDARKFQHEISKIGIKLPKISHAMIYDDDNVFPLTVNKKIWFTLKAAKAMNANVRMSPLVYDIPKKWLPLVEILVGNLFNATQKAGTILGNSRGYERYRKYLESHLRTRIVHKDEIEQYHRKIFRALLGIESDEVIGYRKCVQVFQSKRLKNGEKFLSNCVLEVNRIYK